MAKKPTITTLTAANNNVSTLNANFVALRDAFDRFLSLDGATPNSMSADIDLDSNDVLNIQNLRLQQLYMGGVLVANLGYFPTYRGTWASTTAYTVHDLVYRDDGTTQKLWRATTSHTSSANFATDVANWELWNDKVIDQASVKITGGSIAGITDLAVADGGTGASDAATARTNLSAQQQNAILQSIADLTLVANKALTVNSGATAIEQTDVFGKLSIETDATTAWSVTDADLIGGKLIKANNAAGITVTVPDTLTGTDVLTVVQHGAGTVTFAAGGAATILSKGGLLSTNGQYSIVSLIPLGSNQYYLVGDLV